MIPIKILCGCGQKYAFEVEPVGGLMPSAIGCPVCGADGTTAANSIIAQSIPAQPAPVRVAVARTAPAAQAAAEPPPANAPGPGQGNRAQAEIDARAKISWGDPPKAVITYLFSQGFTYQEASALVNEMFKERAVTIRRNGFVKIFTGLGLMCVPAVAALIFLKIGFFPLKLFAVTVMVGLWGAWMVLKGTFMVVAPKFEQGDVATQ